MWGEVLKNFMVITAPCYLLLSHSLFTLFRDSFHKMYIRFQRYPILQMWMTKGMALVPALGTSLLDLTIITRSF